MKGDENISPYVFREMDIKKKEEITSDFPIWIYRT